MLNLLPHIPPSLLSLTAEIQTESLIMGMLMAVALFVLGPPLLVLAVILLIILVALFCALIGTIYEISANVLKSVTTLFRSSK